MSLLQLVDLSTDIALRKGTVHALDHVNLEVRQGETLGIVGESGSGKTMTVLSVMGLLPQGGQVVGGQIRFDGRDLLGMSPQELRRVRGVEMGMVFQDPLTSLNPTMKIGAQVAEPLRAHQGVSKAEARDRAIEILRRVGMPRPDKIVDNYPHQLSGGMRQRAVIAMALIRNPRLLIADEPTTALDVTTQRQILELIDDLREEFRMAVILVTHDLGVIASRADRVAVMYAGRVVESATTAELFRAPKHRYTEALMHSLPESASDGKLYSIPGMPPDLSLPLVGCRFAERCRFATEECRTTDVTLAGEDHRFACLHPVTSPVSFAPSSQGASREISGESVLSVRDLVKTYDGPHKGVVSAVAGVSFEVRAGETLGIVGESGCGKSTVGRLVAGLEEPTGGQIVLDGTDIATLDRRARRAMHRQVQLMFQDSYAAMNPRMRVEGILAEPLEIQQVGDAAARRTRVAALLDQVGLPSRAVERYPHEFSGGQLQRIGLARSLALSPRLIVADEPVSALDVSIQAQVLNLMRDLQRDLGLSYVFISHDLSVVDYMADRIGVMYLGKLVEIGPARQVVRAARHPYTQALIDAVPSPDPGHAPSPATAIQGELPSALNPPTGCRFRTRCPLAQDICATEPPLQGEEHQVACHFPLRD
ncbi:dipeptide ABC transporter ATP-binding protein [Nonomuraea sp. NPDC050556]|uniref:dipeptide ABC transporter ATP-binding protein n=1 Tax=Nonomuraea sp. NPDC050556 TaxID=3364369 RepID=UPI003788ACFA